MRSSLFPRQVLASSTRIARSRFNRSFVGSIYIRFLANGEKCRIIILLIDSTMRKYLILEVYRGSRPHHSSVLCSTLANHSLRYTWSLRCQENTFISLLLVTTAGVCSYYSICRYSDPLIVLLSKLMSDPFVCLLPAWSDSVLCMSPC
jgi:hypothetical protein